MSYSRKQVVTAISIIYLILVTALSGYASSSSKKFSLPVPQSLTYATTALPIISGLLLEAAYTLTRAQENRKSLPLGATPRPPLVIVANTLIFIYSTVVITLLGTHQQPANALNCGLRERWTALYRGKDVDAVRTIQDAFSCCGLMNSRDMAWPFPDKTHKATACEEAFGPREGCLGPWKREEQKMAGLMMLGVVLVFLWQFTIIAVPTQRESWLHKVVPDRISRIIADEDHNDSGNGSGNRAIDYLPNFTGYSDRIEDETSDNDVEAGHGSGNGARRAIKPTERVDGFLDGASGVEVPPENEWAAAGRRS